MMNYLEPQHEFYGIPKMPPEYAQVDGSKYPYMNIIMPDYSDPFKSNFRQIPEIMSRHQIPLLTTFHTFWEGFPICNFVKKVGGKTMVWQTVHWETDLLFKSKLLKDVDHWVAPTKWAQTILSTVGKIQRKRIKYIPHGTNLERFHPHRTLFREKMRLDSNQKVILFVGRCSLAKGAHQLIPIIRPLVKDYNCVFIIRAGVFGRVTKSAEIGYLFELMSKKTNNVIYLPDWYPPEFMEELVPSCDILVQPSGHEGFDVPLTEAMACKKPIVVTNIPNHREVMGGKNGLCLFMEPTEPAEVINDGKQTIKVPKSDLIYGTLKFMLENPDECEAMAENGYKRVKKEYNLAKISSDWFDYMNEIIPKEYNMDKRIEERLLNG